jgi:putative ABC transport system substrate-binding protein
MKARRKLLVCLGLGVFAPALPLFAQQPGHVPRIGLLWIKEEGTSSYLVALRDGLRALGYVEGKNIRLDDRFLVAGYEGYPAAAANLVREKPDIIVTFGATAAVAAGKATKNIPIVIAAGADPVKLGLAASLARPGGNITGVTAATIDLSGKRLELLREIAPGMRRVAVILNPQSDAAVMALKAYEADARSMNIELRTVEVRTLDAVGPGISAISRANADAIIFVAATLFTANRTLVAAAVQKTGLPAIYSNSDIVDGGGLLAYSTTFRELFRRVAIYVDRILKGAKPGELPIEQPTTFELAVNMKTAKAMGIVIPKSLLARADRIIE